MQQFSAEKVKIGTCAWSFEDWHGAFYPQHLPTNQRLQFYARFLQSVEIDSTFYAAPAPQVAGHWLDITPDEFVFSAKVPREITHERKLRRCEEPLAQFLEGVAPLRRKLGCLLIQLPPYFRLDDDEQALREFVATLPRDFDFAIEFRDASWHLPRIAHLLTENRVCWSWNDVTPIERAGEAAFNFLPVTSKQLYVRLMGDSDSKYRADGSRVHRYRQIMWPRTNSLESWAVRIQQHLDEVARVFIYVNNHFEGFSPHTCQRIAALFGLAVPLPTAADLAPVGDADPGQLRLF